MRAFVRYNSASSQGWLDAIPPNHCGSLEVFAGDITDASRVKEAVKNTDIVFHLASLIAIPYSYAAPESYLQTNVVGTLNILQAARELNCERVLITSTSEVYGTAKSVPILEDHPLQAQSPYAATKIAADKLGESFYRSFGVPVTTVRPFNTYGPRQSARAVIPTIITQLLAGTDPKLGNTRPTRDFVYVKDTAQGFLRIAKSDQAIGETINIATGSEVSIAELLGEIQKLLGSSSKLKTDVLRVRPAESEVERLLGSNEKLFSLTRWKPAVSLAEGLQKTIDWLRKNPLHFDSKKYAT